MIDEEDSSNNYTVRYSSAMVVQTIVGHFKADGVKALTSAVVRHLDAAKKLSASGNKTWWKFIEAAIFAVGTCSDSIASFPNAFDCQGKCQKCQVDRLAFAMTVLLENVSSTNGFVSGRVMWTSSQLAKLVPTDVISPFIKACAVILTSSANHAVKISACKAAAIFSPKVEAQLLIPVLPQIIEGIVTLVPQASEDVLHLVLDSLSVIVKVDQQVSAKYETVLCPAVLAVWAKHINDRFITTIVQDVMQTMANNPLCLTAVTERLYPVIHTILKPGASQPSGVSEAGVSLLTSLTHAYNGKVPDAFFSVLFPLMIDLMLKTEDGSLMQEGATCLAAFVRSGKDTIVQGVKSGFDALTPILKVVARLLTDPAVSDDAARHVGLLISSLILNATQVLSPMLGDLLKSVIVRLAKATQAGLIQSLIIVFAKLICGGHEKDVISFLKAFQMDDKTSGLCYLMKMWTKSHEEFTGAYYLKLSSVALAKVFQCSDSEISQIMVEGDLLVNKNEGIVTRSKKKVQQFSVVPLRVKIVTLLAREHAVIDEEDDEEDEEEGDSVEEEWEQRNDVDVPFDKDTLECKIRFSN